MALRSFHAFPDWIRRHTMKVFMTQFVRDYHHHSKRSSSLNVIYHFWFFLLECTQTLPPAHDPTLCLHQVATNVMEALLLLGGPEQRLKRKALLSISFV